MQLIKDIDQQSPEWFQMRMLKATGTSATAIIANGKGLETLLMEKIGEYFDFKAGIIKEQYSNKHTERGNELEPVARTLFEFELNKEVEEVCFVIKDDYCGCSPDGMVKNENSIIEIKCFGAKHFIEYCETGKIDSVYSNQMQFNMYITGADECYYIVYHPTLGLLVKSVYKDENTFAKIEIGLQVYKEKIINLLNKYEKENVK